MLNNHSKKICGLVGKSLSHSFSPQIHGLLADYKYSLFELSEEKLEGFIKGDSYHAVNVTIPYKKAVIPYLDEISDIAKEIGAVNVIVRRDGKRCGYNTDFHGFMYMLKDAGIDPCGKRALVLGTGGTSATVTAVLRHMGAKSISHVSRTGKICYENAHILCPDTEIIINTTPVGMYPSNGESPVDLSLFPALYGVADVIFNPYKTALLLQAEAMGLPHANGLPMLVEQARVACEIFTDEEIPRSETDRITQIIRRQTQNLVLVGMPGCGKSTVGKLLAEKLGFEFVDTDDTVVKLAGKSIPEIFSEDGEEIFRQIEHRAITLAGKGSGKVIATGGGAVTRRENYNPLHQNGIIIFLTRDIGQLSRDGRPLSQSGDLEKMYEARLPLYLDFCDLITENITPTDAVNEILRAITEDKK